MKNLLVGTILCGMVLVGGCSESNPETPPYKVHPLAWSEPENYTGTDFHGYEVLNFASYNEPCKACHGFDLLGSGNIPGCTDCHENIDGGHLPGYADSAVHGPDALEDFQICKLCHGDDYLGGIAISCADCHTIPWPHPVDTAWLNRSNPQYHGNAANSAIEREDCKVCHGADLRGGSTGVSCFVCHFDETGSDSPPGVNFTSGNHDDDDLHETLSSYLTICNNCHNTNRRFGLAPSACHDCHGDGD
jgi:hypothetical protein